jgi:hypothetical protein
VIFLREILFQASDNKTNIKTLSEGTEQKKLSFNLLSFLAASEFIDNSVPLKDGEDH